MLHTLPNLESEVNPQPESVSLQTFGVGSTDLRVVLWTNVLALMRHHWERESLAELARKAHVGLGTVARVKEQHTSVGIDIVARLADVFHLEAWQLLVPGLDPTNPPTLMPVTAAERALYERLAAAAREFKRNNT